MKGRMEVTERLSAELGELVGERAGSVSFSNQSLGTQIYNKLFSPVGLVFFLSPFHLYFVMSSPTNDGERGGVKVVFVFHLAVCGLQGGVRNLTSLLLRGLDTDLDIVNQMVVLSARSCVAQCKE